MIAFEHVRDRISETFRDVHPAVAAAAVVGALAVLAVVGGVVLPLVLSLLVVGGFVLLVGLWLREFVILMRASDADFPGRFDKVVWAAAILLLPPIGAPAFWAFRKVHWVEHGTKPEPPPWLHDLL